MYEIKAYRCSYCKKYSSSKSVIRDHEKRCFNNPETRSCATCTNLTSRNVKIDRFTTVIDPMCIAGIEFNTKLRHDCHLWKQNTEEHDEIQ